ncbi:MAG: RNA-binding protein [Acidobacteria bacterium]|nr:MAG: RNA-binding protein [Acidobacteriota bacterium]
MKVYVGNLSKEMSETEFTALVTPFGATNSVNLVKDRITGEPRGFGFVEYPNAEHAKAAIAALNGKEVGGRVLRVNESQPKGSRS